MGIADRDDTAPSRAAHVDRWISEYTGQDAPADRLTRMSPTQEHEHLAELRAILLEKYRPEPVPPVLLLPIERRQHAVYTALAATGSGAAAADAAHQAAMSAAYIRELEFQTSSTTTDSETQEP